MRFVPFTVLSVALHASRVGRPAAKALRFALSAYCVCRLSVDVCVAGLSISVVSRRGRKVPAFGRDLNVIHVPHLLPPPPPGCMENRGAKTTLSMAMNLIMNCNNQTPSPTRSSWRSGGIKSACGSIVSVAVRLELYHFLCLQTHLVR